MTRRRASLVARLLAAAAGLAACGDTSTTAVTPLNLDRPTDIAFACYGGLRLVGDNGTADIGDPIVSSAQSMESCRLYALPPPPPDPDDPDPDDGPVLPQRPPGQEPLEGGDPVPSVEYYGFVLQSVPGTVALAQFAAKPAVEATLVDVVVFDADPLTPGQNGISVGDLPVAIAPDSSGCHMMTANAGSCDLSVIDVTSVVDGDENTPPRVRALDVVNAAGDPVIARPAALVASPVDPAVGDACPAEPEGVVWVAYPECHLVAAITPATGEIVAGVRFTDTGTVELTDGNVTCPAQCGGGGTLGPGERPVTLDLVRDARVGTTRLAIGADNSAMLTMVELDADALPLSFSRIELEGDIGVLDVALSTQIGMGGSSGRLNDDEASGGQAQFVYAVVDDGTVRVAEVLNRNSECDTQVDPRYLRGNLSVVEQVCYRVGDPETPPRRAFARGPGIEFIDGSPATSVAIIRTEPANPDIGVAEQPDALIGTFAYVSAASGEVSIVNIDDDNFTDAWVAAAPIDGFIPNIIAHQWRDAVPQRFAQALTQIPGLDEDNNGEDDFVFNCTERGGFSGGLDSQSGGPRLTADPGLAVADTSGDRTGRYLRPGPRRVVCFDEAEETTSSVLEMHFAAPPEVRDATFPDHRANRFFESWRLTWEGPLSDDGFGDSIDGPAERGGLLEIEDGQLSLIDPARPFCDAGVEPWDWVELLGCDPAAGDADCGLGLTCYVHPDAELGVGQCLPAELADELATTCRDHLVTARRFGVATSTAGELTLVPRRRVLDLTPLDGCESDAQCEELAVEEALVDAMAASGSTEVSLHPKDFTPPDDLGTYSCRRDPSRTQGAAGIRRCVQTCQVDDECGAGAVCTAGECVEGVVPPAACVPGVERYALRAGDAYAVIGSATGYLHNIIENPTTGACEPDPAGHPLIAGRIRLRDVPACTGGGFTDVSPNPCLTTVEHAQDVPVYNDQCVVQDPSRQLLIEDVPAIRFQNPALSFHLVGMTYPGDARCREDRAGGRVGIPYVSGGDSVTLSIAAGFVPLRPGVSPVFPVAVVRGPEDMVWIVDHGDTIPDGNGGLSTRGQVFRTVPGNFPIVNVVR